MSGKHKTLRSILILIILSMGVVSGLLIAISESIFHGLVRESEQAALADLVSLNVTDLINEQFEKTKKLGLSLQSEKAIRESIRAKDYATVVELLNSQFHQFFVTAGIVDLKKIYLLDKSYKYLSESTEGIGKTGPNDIPCEIALLKAKTRKGAERLKPMPALCSGTNQKMNFMTIVPIGTLSPIGYLMILSDLTTELRNIEEDLGMPVLIFYSNAEIAYRSDSWKDIEASSAHVQIKHDLLDGGESPVIKVHVGRNITLFQKEWDRIGWYVLIAAIAIIVLTIVGLLIVLRKGLHPLEQLRHAAERLSAGELNTVSTTSYPEIDIPIQSFNNMAKKITQLIRDLESEIYERKAVEEKLKEYQNHLEQLVEERTKDLAIARDKAMAASEAKGEFLANMSHELRTPLNAIIGYSELVQEDIVSGDSKASIRDLDKIIASGKHLSDLIKGILDLSKIEAGKMDVEYTTFDVMPFINQTIDSVRPLMQEKNNTFELKISKDVASITADQTKLRQSILNLLSNAAKFTSNGTIRLEVLQAVSGGDSWIIFSVTDTGIGISEEKQEELWDVFTQADSSTTREYGGTGLGLAISKKFCEMMGGSISLESKVGKGSTFTIKLPLARENSEWMVGNKPDANMVSHS